MPSIFLVDDLKRISKGRLKGRIHWRAMECMGHAFMGMAHRPVLATEIIDAETVWTFFYRAAEAEAGFNAAHLLRQWGIHRGRDIADLIHAMTSAGLLPPCKVGYRQMVKDYEDVVDLDRAANPPN